MPVETAEPLHLPVGELHPQSDERAETPDDFLAAAEKIIQPETERRTVPIGDLYMERHLAMTETEVMAGPTYAELTKEIDQVDTRLSHIAPQDFFSERTNQLFIRRTDLLIQRGMVLKMLWNQRDYTTLTDNYVPARIQSVASQLEKSIKTNPVYVIELPKGAKDTRQVIDPDDHLRELDSYLRILGQIPGIYTNKIHRSEIREMINYFVPKDSQKIYTRPGLDGLLDSLRDEFAITEAADLAVSEDNNLDIHHYLPMLSPKIRKKVIDLEQQGKLEDSSALIEESLPSKIRLDYQQRWADAQGEFEKKVADAIEVLKESTNAVEVTPLMPEGEKPALETRLLLAKFPDLREAIQELEMNGVELSLLRIKKTPPSVLKAIERITVMSQGNYVMSWLPNMIQHGELPTISTDEPGRKRAVIKGLIKQGEEPNLEKDVALIHYALGNFLKVVALDSQQLTPEQHQTIDQINQAFQEPSRNYALHRMLYDKAAPSVERGTEALRSATHGIEHVMEVGVLKGSTLTAGAMLYEWDEVKSLLSSGYSMKDLAPRLALTVPIIGLSAMTAVKIRDLMKDGHNEAAFALFALANCALMFTTSLFSVAMFKHSYDTLVSEGKLSKTLPQFANNPAFQNTLEMFEKSHHYQDMKEELITIARQTLQANPGRMSDQAIELFLGEIRKLDFDLIVKQLKTPSELARWKTAIFEEYANPKRLAGVIGGVVAPLAILGLQSLAGPLVQSGGEVAAATYAAAHGREIGVGAAAFGVVESTIIASVIKAAQLWDEVSYQLDLRRAINQAEAPEASPTIPTVTAENVV